MNNYNIQNDLDLNQPHIIENLNNVNNLIHLLKNEISKVVVGNDNIINFIIISLICNGHILLEGVPGIAKTTIIKAIANALGLDFKRIQFTPDLLPSDLIGTLIYNPKNQDFETKKGPIFSNMILADEINRAPAKVQSALLESMQEHQVTIGSTTFKLEEPFFVFATQNPIEQQGTYQLPEAQLDRFMFKLLMSYPNLNEEKNILKKLDSSNFINKVISKDQIFRLQEIIKTVYIDERIIDYIIKIVSATRNPEMHNAKLLKSYIQYGVSPRATIALYNASKAYALIKNRYFVIPDDVRTVCYPILRHRITLHYQAESEGITADCIVNKVLEIIPTP